MKDARPAPHFETLNKLKRSCSSMCHSVKYSIKGDVSEVSSSSLARSNVGTISSMACPIVSTLSKIEKRNSLCRARYNFHFIFEKHLLTLKTI